MEGHQLFAGEDRQSIGGFSDSYCAYAYELIFAWWTLAFAQADDVRRPDSEIIADEQEKCRLSLFLEILEDPSWQMTFVDAHSNNSSGMVQSDL